MDNSENSKNTCGMWVKTVPDWQQRLRDFVDQLLEDLDKQ
jgi:hypothetical protein